MLAAKIGMNSDHYPLVAAGDAWCQTPPVLPSPGPVVGRGHDLTEAVLRPARGYHAFEACVEQLATTIRLGVYPLGSTLPSERELAERLNVSRSTLREAMAALREAGLVETRRGRGGGTIVTLKPRTPSARAAARLTEDRRQEWLDSLVFRRIVEPGAASLAAKRRPGRRRARPARRGPRCRGERPPPGATTARPTPASTSRWPP